ncbi:MAG: glycosyltransferase family 2 protein [Verrucomicrobiaceae bacterium]|nr:MAG: glycosyltransferase family 2 protein [Verrucomicrobiaceae bacterium]
MLLSIVIPVYNERELVTTLLDKVAALSLQPGISKEVIVVDDGSNDGTVERIAEWMVARADPAWHFLPQKENRGKGAAVRTGFGAAQGDIVIVQDADLEYEPEDIRDVIAPIVRGEAKIVYGSRILREKALGRSGVCGLITGKHPHSYVMAYLGGVMITKWTNLLTGAKLTDEPTCYKCFHRSVLEGVEIECDDFSWEPEITVKLLRKGYRILEVPISYHPRKMAEGKKINWTHGVSALWTVLKYRLR